MRCVLLLFVVIAGLATVLSAAAPDPAQARASGCAAKKGKAKRACMTRDARRRATAHRKAKSPVPNVVTAAAGPTPAPAPTPASAPAVTPPAATVTTWRPVGSQPLSDADAAAGVRPAPETRPGNAVANGYRPSAAELNLFRNGQTDGYGRTALTYNRLTAHVTGGFSGTTDEILQWAARKWGIPEDVVRAVAANESWWSMAQLGDARTVIDAGSYPEQSRIAGTSDVYQSLGIMQVKWTPQGLHPGTEPLRWRSTAFNADYWGAVVRYYFDGLCDWCGSGYAAGQERNSIGAWYNPSPWGTGSQTYQDHVGALLAAPPWALIGF